ncbi:LytR/AlgR family response regulator transcription factor [Seonamhaeicola marinus]|uniref:LytTR family transcriptional regulator n=1 Tax=Seonamhaeicola marinus TaxID=1912246 RepID=A0A5D0HS69_9FLAO|nr:LytTR family DNA-binding domain-containing protein [Seonamhaeicola marinus]TYA73991.1 LytTR family transcriptional regulator [Seonamhaeicola marinus]
MNNLQNTNTLRVLDVNSFNLEDIIQALNGASTDKNNEIFYLVVVNSKEKQNVIKTPQNQGLKGKILIPLQDGFEVINKASIVYCEADDNYTELYLRNGEKYLVSKTLKYFEDILGSENFVRIHKSFLVNVNDIVKYYRKGKTGSVLLSNGKEIAVSATKRVNLMSYFK